MDDPDRMRITGVDLRTFMTSFAAAIQSLPADRRARLLNIRANSFAAFGFDGTYQRLNNRTVGEILAEFGSLKAKVVESGRVGDLSYTLYEQPPAPPDEGPDANRSGD